MNEARHLLARFEPQDLAQEANNLMVALNLSLIDASTPFIDERTKISLGADLLDHLVEVEVHVDSQMPFEYALICIREVWEQILKLDQASFENYRVIRHAECALIEAVSVNDQIGCAVQFSVFPANNVVPFRPSSQR